MYITWEKNFELNKNNPTLAQVFRSDLNFIFETSLNKRRIFSSNHYSKIVFVIHKCIF